MKTLRDLLWASLLASLCLAPVVNADVARAFRVRPPQLPERSFATAQVLSTEDAGRIQAVLPQMVVHLLRPLLAAQR